MRAPPLTGLPASPSGTPISRHMPRRRGDPRIVPAKALLQHRVGIGTERAARGERKALAAIEAKRRLLDDDAGELRIILPPEGPGHMPLRVIHGLSRGGDGSARTNA